MTEPNKETTDKITVPWFASTNDLRHFDPGFDRLAKAAADNISAPTLLLTRANYFENLILSSLHHCPVFVIWLPLAYSASIFSLGRAVPVAGTKLAPDLSERTLVLKWVSTGFAFSVEVEPLSSCIEERIYGAIPVIFATETQTAVTELSIDDGLLTDLSYESRYCDEYAPPGLPKFVAREDMNNRLNATFKLDGAGNKIILLHIRRAISAEISA